MSADACFNIPLNKVVSIYPNPGTTRNHLRIGEGNTSSTAYSTQIIICWNKLYKSIKIQKYVEYEKVIITSPLSCIHRYPLPLVMEPSETLQSME